MIYDILFSLNIMDLETSDSIFRTLSPDLEPRPRDLASLRAILKLSYELLDHPIFSSWKGYDHIDPFLTAMDHAEHYKNFNRTIIERTLLHCEYYGRIKLQNGILTISSKGIELAIQTIKDLIDILKDIDKRSDEEVEELNLHHFRLHANGQLTGTIKYLILTCNELILLVLKHQFDGRLKGYIDDRDKVAFILRYKADLEKNKDQFDGKLYDGMSEYLKIELTYHEKLKESTSNGIEVLGIIDKFLSEAKAKITNHRLLGFLLENKLEEFKKALSDVVIQLFSFHDISKNEPEKVYHAFLLGVLNGFGEFYKLSSNREAGLGRFDILLVPFTTELNGVIIEVKKASGNEMTVINGLLEHALNQVEEKKYDYALKMEGISNYVVIAAVFCGKELFLAHRFIVVKGGNLSL